MTNSLVPRKKEGLLYHVLPSEIDIMSKRMVSARRYSIYRAQRDDSGKQEVIYIYFDITEVEPGIGSPS